MMVGKTFQPSKYYGARIAHRGKALRPVDKIIPIFSKKFDNNVTLFYTKTNKRNNKLIFKSNELPQKNSKKIIIDDVEYENDIKKSSSKQQLGFKLVKKHITSYVLNMIPVKSINPNELEKSCLLKSKI